MRLIIALLLVAPLAYAEEETVEYTVDVERLIEDASFLIEELRYVPPAEDDEEYLKGFHKAYAEETED